MTEGFPDLPMRLIGIIQVGIEITPFRELFKQTMHVIGFLEWMLMKDYI
jgi:hypothetical protein